MRFEDNGFDVRGDLVSRRDVLCPKILRLLVIEENGFYGVGFPKPSNNTQKYEKWNWIVLAGSLLQVLNPVPFPFCEIEPSNDMLKSRGSLLDY